MRKRRSFAMSGELEPSGRRTPPSSTLVERTRRESYGEGRRSQEVVSETPTMVRPSEVR